MEMNIWRKLPFAAAALMATSAFAAMDTDSRATQLEKQMMQVRTETANGTYGAKTASARPEHDGYGLNLSVDVLYWRSRVGGTDFVLTDQTSTAALPLSGELKDITPGWDWGFRVGAGYAFDHDGWDVSIQYTYFKNNEGSEQAIGQNDTLIPLKGSSNIVTGAVGSFTQCSKAVSQLNNFFQNLELQLGRNYFVSEFFSLRPSVGIQTAWIDLKQETTYSLGSQLNDHLVQVNDESDFWGMGPQVAIAYKLHLVHGFSFFGNFSGSVLYGNWDVEHKNWFSGDLVTPNNIKVLGDLHAFTPTARMLVGVAYDTYLDDNKQHLSVSLGYDTQYWWRQNQMLQVSDESAGTNELVRYNRIAEDLAMHGVTGEIRWDF